MIGSIEINLWPLAVVILPMVALIAFAGYNESLARRDKHAKDDKTP
tara:strand:- start:4469 stop:4606 length:138 start_codon:yes stop_codon:yes gene_type:complete